VKHSIISIYINSLIFGYKLESRPVDCGYMIVCEKNIGYCNDKCEIIRIGVEYKI